MKQILYSRCFFFKPEIFSKSYFLTLLFRSPSQLSTFYAKTESYYTKKISI